MTRLPGNNLYTDALTIEPNQFISIDIQKANFQVINRQYPNIFNASTWETYIARFSTHQFLIGSKLFREKIFGKLGQMKQICQMCENLVTQLIEELALNQEIVVRCQDEVVYRFGNLEQIVQYVDLNYPDVFHIKVFRLKKLGPTQYVKEYEFPDKSVEFKCCNIKYMMQCIRHYQNEPVTNLDLKFMDDGRCATYDTPIFYQPVVSNC